MKTRYSIIIILALVNLSCSNLNEKTANIKRIEVFEEEKVLIGSILGLNNFFKDPQSLDFMDSMLMVIDGGTEKTFHFMSLRNYTIINSYGFRGNGPAEFVNAPNSLSQFSQDRKHIFILEWDKTRLIKFSIDSMMSNKSYFPDKFFVPPSELGYIYGMLYISDSIFVGTCQNGEGRLFRWNAMNDSLTYFPWIPVPTKKIIPQALEELYHERIAVKPDLKYIVSAMEYFNRIDIFTPQLELNTSLLFSEHSDPLSAYNDKFINWDNVISFFGPDIYITDKYIYVSYRGLTSEEFNDQAVDNKFQIQIFDWEGNAKLRLKLDRFIYPFTVDEKNRKIYGIDYFNPEQPLILYTF